MKKWVAVNINNELDNNILIGIHSVFKNGFERDGWSIDGIKHRLQNSDILYLLKDKLHRIFGYAIYSIPSMKFSDKTVIWEDAICINKDLQNKGFLSDLNKVLISSINDIGYFGGRTQNPLMFKRYKKFGKLFPFENPFNSELGKQLMSFLLNNIEEVKSCDNFDKLSGICKRVYKEGTLGNYHPVEEVFRNDMLVNIQTHLSKHGFKPNKGDCIVIVSQII